MNPLIITGFIAVGIYLLMILASIIGWYLPKKRKLNISKHKNTKVSVIIPFRNEEENISTIVDSLKNQSYSPDLLEVILINDHSTDKSLQQATSKCSTIKHFRVVTLEDDKTGKKSAITQAINISSGDLIITTDADCTHNKKWIESIVSHYENNNNRIIIGPIALEHSSKPLSVFQRFEQTALSVMTGGSSKLKRPIMCSGANLAYEKTLFNEISDPLNKSFASGDDMFLLQNVKMNYPKDAIGYIKDKEAIVSTQSAKSINEIVNQKARWTSKAKGYTDIMILYPAVITFLANIIIIAVLFRVIIDPLILKMALIVYGSKIAADIIAVLPGISWFTKPSNLLLFIPLAAIYPFYILAIGIISFTKKATWKDRTC